MSEEKMRKETLVVPRTALEDAGFIPSELPNGYKYTRINNLADLLRLFKVTRREGSYKERFGDEGVENNPSLQQVAMYGVVTKPDGRFLLYQRSSDLQQYHESRLSGKVSIGIGGHMEPTDLSFAQSFYREFDEEAQIFVDGALVNLRDVQGKLDIRLMKSYVTIRPVGVIKDDSSDVGKVHFGVVCRVEAKPNVGDVDIQVRVGDKEENVTSEYLTPDQYRARTQSGELTSESWADIVFHEELEQAA